MTDYAEWGPLAWLVGEWEGDDGLDISWHNVEGEIGETKFREKVSMKAFGPVDNGTQHLYGLDYRMAAWRAGEENPFHTEVGYWLWDGATGEVMRCFVVPRGITTFAGGTAAADATEFTLRADKGADLYNIGENQYLAKHASTISYEATIIIGDGEWSYAENTQLKMDEFPDLFNHTDHNTLRPA